MHTRADQLLPQLLIEILILCLHNADTLNICMKEFCTQKNIIDKMAAMRTLTFFRLVSTKRGYACSMIVHTPVDQHLAQLLMELFDTLYTQCKHIEHMHEGVWFIKTYY